MYLFEKEGGGVAILFDIYGIVGPSFAVRVNRISLCNSTNVLKWEHLEMSGFERRKLLCAVMFHAVALTCVVWSLYVLIDRTAEEIQSGVLEWPFWTKLIVVAIGFTGGAVFMYIQCKAYLQICQRWKAFNR